jgi:hypothetical protein
MKKKNDVELFINYFLKKINLNFLILYSLILLSSVFLNSFLLYDKYKKQKTTTVYIFQVPAIENLDNYEKIYSFKSFSYLIEKNRDKSLNYCPVNLETWDQNIFYKHQIQFPSFDREYFSLAVTALGKNEKKLQECLDFFFSELRSEFDFYLKKYLDGLTKRANYLNTLDIDDDWKKKNLIGYRYILETNINTEVKLYDIKEKKIFLPILAYSNIIIFLIVTILLFSFIILKNLKLRK